MAERRKNDPVLNHTQDHLVRKLFNKFKKGPDVPSGGVVGPDKTAPMPSLPPQSANANNRDIEKGTSAASEAASNSMASLSKAATGNNTAASDGVTPLESISVPAMAVPKKPSGLKGWGRLKVSIILCVTYLRKMYSNTG